VPLVGLPPLPCLKLRQNLHMTVIFRNRNKMEEKGENEQEQGVSGTGQTSG
jgi:hypothetical protein